MALRKKMTLEEAERHYRSMDGRFVIENRRHDAADKTAIYFDGFVRVGFWDTLAAKYVHKPEQVQYARFATREDARAFLRRWDKHGARIVEVK